jgi:thymidylate synthase (FAD)
MTILTMRDPWKDLREDCFGNVEPEVKLEGLTVPVAWNDLAGDSEAPGPLALQSGDRIDNREIEILPALAAGTSYGSREKLEGDMERALKLNRNLIKLGHHTPLEAIQLNFHVSGISKACGAQISRHRVGQGHVSASRRFQAQGPRFVYPLLAYIKERQTAEAWLSWLSDVNRYAFERYLVMRGDADQADLQQTPDTPAPADEFLHKEDARLAIPVSTATERSWWINARALRDFFRLRLAADAEWEIRRIAQMMFNIVYPMFPSLFEDLAERFQKTD